MFNAIAISLSPNTQKKDYTSALNLLFSPPEYSRGVHIKKLEDWFKDYFKVKFAISFDSGRSGELAILSSLGIGWGDEVLIQAFTCVAVPNSVIWTGAKPIYVDINKATFNMDPGDLERRITKKAKAIIVQHTFGIIADIQKIKAIAKAHNLVLIEDCAHSLGSPIYGDVAFFSFGRDKIISSVFGGMVVTNDKIIGEKISDYQKKLSTPNIFWTIQQLLHPVFFSIILPTYNFFGLGKVILVVAQKLYLLSFPVADVEKRAGKPSFYPKKMPNALAKLAFLQLGRLAAFNRRRQEIAKIYARELNMKIKKEDIFLRFPMLVDKPKELLAFAKKGGILIGDWYSNIIDPKGVNLNKVGYIIGSCPVAEEAASKIINLPTYPRMTNKDVEKVIRVIREFNVKNN